MKTTLVNFFAALLLVASYSAHADEFRILPKPEKISKHVYAWIGPHGGPNTKNKGYRMNMAFVVGKNSVAVIESGYYPEMAEEIIKHIRKVTDKPIKFVINTNSQPDRFYGNMTFHKLGIKTLAHPNEIARMRQNANNYALVLERSMKFKNTPLPEPAMQAIDKPTKIDLGGGVSLELAFHKAAHTPTPLIVHIPLDNIVYAGDILYSGRLLAVVPGGSIAQWIETFQYLKKYGNATFIPGHGKPAKLAAFKKSTHDYLVMLNNHMVKMVDDGVDMTDSIKNLDQSEFSYLENFKELAGRNANRAYQEAELAAF